ncbi:alpha/beta hydrolase [Streptomyces sp. NPDC058470]|uniref:alpha/beta hydrolase n=1 Tax=Streptomyces sp. NPDC058470 TaxID=3346515 RepID=UPI00364A49A5
MKALPMLPLPLARAILHPYYRFTFQHRMPWSVQRALLNIVARMQPLPPDTSVGTLRLGARPAERISVGATTGTGAVLYLHGGGFTVGSPVTHRSLAAHLAREIRRPVYLLDYRLAPEHPFPAALEDTVAAFGALTTTEGHSPGSIVLAGDSAGGCIALAAAQQLTTVREQRPAALVLISPWANPNLVAEQRRDLVVNRAWGLACTAAYLGAGDPSDPRYAPQLGSHTGLPPTYLHTNTRELLYAQCRDLAVSLRGAGVPLRYAESPVLWHAAQAQAGLVREAAASLRDIGGFLTEHWSSRQSHPVDDTSRDGARPS